MTRPGVGTYAGTVIARPTARCLSVRLLVALLAVAGLVHGCSQRDESDGTPATARQATPNRSPTGTGVSTPNTAPPALRTPRRATVTTPLGEADGPQYEPVFITTTAEPDEGGVPLTVVFVAEVEGGPPNMRFRWDFGDGSPPSYGLRAEHTYRRADDFTAVFSATGYGVEETDEVYVQVSEEGFDVSIDAAPDIGRPPLTVHFSASLDDDLVGPFYYQWDFGDGGRDVSNPTTHTYRSPGEYTATLTVTNAAGQVGRNDVVIQVDVDSAAAPAE